MTHEPRYETFVGIPERGSHPRAVGHLADIDLSAVDIRALSPGQWELIKQEVKRRACEHRAELIADLITRMRAWFAELKYHRDPVVQTDAVSHQPHHWLIDR